MSTIVYKYGLHAPHENAEIVADLLQRSWRFRRALTAVYNEKRDRIRKLTDEDPRVLPALEAAVLADERYRVVSERRKRERIDGGSRSVSDTTAQMLAKAKEEVKATRNALAKARASVLKDPRARALLDEWNLEKNAGVRAARAELEVPSEPGAYYVKTAAAQADSTMQFYGRDGLRPKRLRYPEFSAGGRLGINHGGGGMSMGDVLAGRSTKLRIVLPPETAWSAPSRAQRRSDRRLGLLRLRVASDERRGPIWASFVLDMHRPLPEDAMIKWATVRNRGIGPHSRWELTLTVETSRRMPKPEGQIPDSACAVSLACVEDDAGLRVATWVGTDGRSGEVRIHASGGSLRNLPLLQALERARDIRSQRDLRRNAIRERVCAIATGWSDTARDRLSTLLGDKDKLRSMHQWVSPARFVRLKRALGALLLEARSVGCADEPALRAAWDALESYCARDRHEWAVESSWSERSRARRREQYRLFGAQLAERYECIVFADADLVRLRPDEDDHRHDAGEKRRSLSALASPGELRDSVKLTAVSRGALVVFMPAARGRNGSAASVAGADAKTLLDAYLAAPEKSTTSRTARKAKKSSGDERPGEGRQQRIARKNKERLERVATARKAAGKAA